MNGRAVRGRLRSSPRLNLIIASSLHWNDGSTFHITTLRTRVLLALDWTNGFNQESSSAYQIDLIS